MMADLSNFQMGQIMGPLFALASVLKANGHPKH